MGNRSDKMTVHSDHISTREISYLQKHTIFKTEEIMEFHKDFIVSIYMYKLKKMNMRSTWKVMVCMFWYKLGQIQRQLVLYNVDKTMHGKKMLD